MTIIALFFEYVDYNLSNFMTSKIINSTSKSLIVLNAVHAINFLYKKGLIQRNLKIENIILNALFETKIVDFGFASISEAAIEGFSHAHDSLTKGIGILAYISPEMANENNYDNKTDVY